MRKLLFPALLAAAVVALTAFSRPPVNELVEGPVPKCGANSDICLGTSSTQVQLGGNVLVNKPILVGPSSSTSTIVIDAGVTIVGSVTTSGTEKVAVLDAGVAMFNGEVQIIGSTTITTCTLNGASPSVCTATVRAGSKCTCSPVGATAAIAAGGCAVGLSGTTVTVTSVNAGNWVVNLHCF